MIEIIINWGSLLLGVKSDHAMVYDASTPGCTRLPHATARSVLRPAAARCSMRRPEAVMYFILIKMPYGHLIALHRGAPLAAMRGVATDSSES
jgi:hypothetical protein